MAGKSTPLTAAEQALVARAALDNAVELLADARLLLEAQRWPRAFALAVLAGEEYGKFQLTMMMALYAPEDAVAWREYWVQFSSHNPKIAAWIGQHIDMQDWFRFPESDEAWQKAWNERLSLARVTQRDKLAAFYTEFRDGEVHIPAEVVTAEAAQSAVKVVGGIVDWAADAFAGDLTQVRLPPELNSLFAQAKLAETSEERSRLVTQIDEWLSDWEERQSGGTGRSGGSC